MSLLLATRTNKPHIHQETVITVITELSSNTKVFRLYHDTQTDILPGYPESAICVQRFDDSLHSAIHTTYRNWLRSSSMHEPRDPPLKVVKCLLSSLDLFYGLRESVILENSIVCVKMF